MIEVFFEKESKISADLALALRALTLFIIERSDVSRKNISITYNFKRKLDHKDDDGNCEIIGYNTKGKPRNFVLNITLDKKTRYRDTLDTAAHELIHVIQFASGRLAIDLTKWEGEKVEEDLTYWNHPWEAEAYGLGTCLFNDFIEKNKLTPGYLARKSKSVKFKHSN